MWDTFQSVTLEMQVNPYCQQIFEFIVQRENSMQLYFRWVDSLPGFYPLKGAVHSNTYTNIHLSPLSCSAVYPSRLFRGEIPSFRGTSCRCLLANLKKIGITSLREHVSHTNLWPVTSDNPQKLLWAGLWTRFFRLDWITTRMETCAYWSWHDAT